MGKKEYNGILMICWLLLTSCLGDTSARITMGEQEAVYQSYPTKGFYVSDGRFLYGTNLSVTGDTGDCFLIEYSFDSADSELQDSDSLSIELVGQPIAVSLWPSDSNITDTTAVLEGEVLTKSLLGRKAYINGRLFLWSNHTELQSQQDSFMISYDSDNMYTEEEGKRIYNLYLRVKNNAAESEDSDETSKSALVTNAFDISEFFSKAKSKEEAMGATELLIAIHYASAYNKDTTACSWGVTEPMQISITGNAE